MKRTVWAPLLIWAAIAPLLLMADAPTQALAQDPQRVGLVVRFDDDEVFTQCIEFSQPEINGCDVLDLSSLSLVYGGYGSYGQAVCAINDVGCVPPENCFCKCAGVHCEYWAYYHLAGRKWNYSTTGCSSYSVHDGDVEGWAWGSGTVGGTSEVEPPVRTFEELCPPAAPPVVELYAEPASIIAGQCSTVYWSVENAGGVTLNGEGVRPTDSRYVCPQQTQTFELLAFNDSGEYSYEVIIRVTSPSPTPRPTATPTRTPTATTQPSSVPPPAATRIPQAPAVPTSPSPTSTPTATSTSIPTLAAVVENATPTVEATQVAAATESPSPPAPREQSVGLDRLLLLLGVGAGTVGFGTIAFVAMLVLLIAIYLRARTQF